MFKVISMLVVMTMFNGCGIEVYKIDAPGYTTQTWVQFGDNFVYTYGGERIKKEEPEAKTYVDSEYLSELAYNSEENSWN